MKATMGTTFDGLAPNTIINLDNVKIGGASVRAQVGMAEKELMLNFPQGNDPFRVYFWEDEVQFYSLNQGQYLVVDLTDKPETVLPGEQFSWKKTSMPDSGLVNPNSITPGGDFQSLYLEGVKNAGKTHDFGLQYVGDKLQVTLLQSSKGGASPVQLYRANFGPQGVSFERSRENEVQSLQTVVDKEKSFGLRSVGDLVWREDAPHSRDGYDFFRVNLE